MEQNKYISVTAAARLAGVSSQTILNMCHNKAISCRLNGRIYTVLESDVKAYASKIQDIQVSLVAIEAYKDRMAKMANDHKTDMLNEMRRQHDQLMLIRMYPKRVKAINEMLIGWIERMKEYDFMPDFRLTWRQIDVLLEVLQNGKTVCDLSTKYMVTPEAARQMWGKAIIAFGRCKNHIDYMDEQIKELKQSLQEKNNEIARLNAIIKGEPIPELTTEDMRIAKLLKTSICDIKYEPSGYCFNYKGGLTGLSVRAINCLEIAEIKTLRDLVSYTKEDLLKYRNFGRKSLAELDDMLEYFGLRFGMDVSIYPEVVA